MTVQFVASDAGQERECEASPGGDATIGDLARAVFAGPVGSLEIDGREVDPEAPMTEAGLLQGSVLTSVAEGTRADPPGDPVVDFQVLSGAGAGMAVGLRRGRYVIGAGGGAQLVLRSPGVRPRHAELIVDATVRIRTNATQQAVSHESVVRIGGSLVAVVARQAEGRLRPAPGRRGTVAFNRRPRPGSPGPGRSIHLPETPKTEAATGRLGWIALAAPILFGLVMAVVVDPRMALFALLGPVMMGASWLDDRGRVRRGNRKAAAQIEADAVALEHRMRIERAREVVRLRRGHPSVASLAALARNGGPSMWERRQGDDDFMRLVCGYGPVGWSPTFDRHPDDAAELTRSVVAGHATLVNGPVTVDLRPGQVLGVAGERSSALDLVRGLVCQTAVLHGPADVTIAVVTSRPNDWEWAKWLPHTVAGPGSRRRFLASTPVEAAKVVERLAATMAEAAESARRAGPLPIILLAADVGDLATAETAGVRHMLSGRSGPIAGIVVADEPDDLPSVCSSTVVVRAHEGIVTAGGIDLPVATAGAVVPVARGVARSLARFDDPEAAEAGSELPSSVRLLDVLDLAEATPERVVERWTAGDGRPVAVIGVTETGVLELDLSTDGPHGLLGGTTGAGKSELLRALVASLAVRVDPGRLTFVLIDYKGGSAFDACAALPHTVGLVTDLDGRLAQRALRCLEAELRHREHLLREEAVDDLDAYRRLDGGEPLPRMLIVVDEFAALARELPEFMDSLVDIAARGRSLGVHLVLATQRPAGVIREPVRANTNLRIALRVQDRADSQDLIGHPGAADIARANPGRGLLRLGPSELIAFQTTRVTAPHRETGGDRAADIDIGEFRFGFEPSAPEGAQTASDEGPSDLDVVVGVVARAARQLGLPPPRRPWPEPLPHVIHLDEVDDLGAGDDGVVLGLVDEPDLQRVRPFTWNPDSGPLAMYGVPGAGTTTALATIAVGLARTHRSDELHMYVLDHDSGGLSPLVGLPHVGAVIGSGERERALRLLRMLVDELEARKHALPRGHASLGGAGAERIVLLVDGLDALWRAFEGVHDVAARDAIIRVIAEGPSAGIVTVTAATRANSIPSAADGAVGNRLVFRLADPLGAAAFGVRSVDDLPAGRAVHAATGRLVQIAAPRALGETVAALTGIGCAPGGPRPIGVMPEEVKPVEIERLLQIDEDRWCLPVGIGEDLEAIGVTLATGDHVLVVGGPRSGKTSLLAALADIVSNVAPWVSVTAMTPRPSILGDVAGVTTLVTDPQRLPAVTATVLAADGPQLVLIDDADDLDAVALRDLAATRRPDTHVIAAVRPEVKSVYDHWAKGLTTSRTGLWLRPSAGVDADLWRTPLPRRLPERVPPGRGYLVADGMVELFHAVRR